MLRQPPGISVTKQAFTSELSPNPNIRIRLWSSQQKPLTLGNPIMVLRNVRADVALGITPIWNDEGDTVCLEVLEAETKEKRPPWPRKPYKDHGPWKEHL